MLLNLPARYLAGLLQGTCTAHAASLHSCFLHSCFLHSSQLLQDCLMYCVHSLRFKVWVCMFEDWSTAAMWLHLPVLWALLQGTCRTHALRFSLLTPLMSLCSLFLVCYLRTGNAVRDGSWTLKFLMKIPSDCLSLCRAWNPSRLCRS
jgi:hypothetical protein